MTLNIIEKMSSQQILGSHRQFQSRCNVLMLMIVLQIWGKLVISVRRIGTLPKFSVSTVTKIDESEYWRHHGQRDFSTPDAEVERNYQRVYHQMVKEVIKSEERTNVQIREQVIGQVRDSLQSIFPDLWLHSLEDPEGGGTFYFEKGDG